MPKKPDALLVIRENISSIIEDKGGFKLYPMFPFDEEKGFEMLNIEIEPGFSSISEPHEENTEEYLTVYEGKLTLKVDEGEAIEVRRAKAFLAACEELPINIFEGELIVGTAGSFRKTGILAPEFSWKRAYIIYNERNCSI